MNQMSVKIAPIGPNPTSSKSAAMPTVAALYDALAAVVQLSRLSSASVPPACAEQLGAMFKAADEFIVRNVPLYTGHSFGDTVLFTAPLQAAQLARLDSVSVDEDGAPMLDLACLDANGAPTGKRIQTYLEACHTTLSALAAPATEEAPDEPLGAPGN